MIHYMSRANSLLLKEVEHWVVRPWLRPAPHVFFSLQGSGRRGAPSSPVVGWQCHRRYPAVPKSKLANTHFIGSTHTQRSLAMSEDHLLKFHRFGTALIILIEIHHAVENWFQLHRLLSKQNQNQLGSAPAAS